MKLYDYLETTPEKLQEYLDAGLVDTAHHPTFPLTMFTYGRECVALQAWDNVTTRCRGLIVNEETDEIVARPFEKFFNYGEVSTDVQYTGVGPRPEGEPDYILEKMDGFLITLYEWQGVQYAASKGSFDSPHAKWATAWLRQRDCPLLFPPGWTAVFEGVTSSLRIVVDYKGREELVLLGIVKIETGEEMSRPEVESYARLNKLSLPIWHKLGTVGDFVKATLNPDVKNVEGYVLVWDRPGETPFRLKLKYTDYLRIHRMVCGVSPKRVRSLSERLDRRDEYVARRIDPVVQQVRFEVEERTRIGVQAD